MSFNTAISVAGALLISACQGMESVALLAQQADAEEKVKAALQDPFCSSRSCHRSLLRSAGRQRSQHCRAVPVDCNGDDSIGTLKHCMYSFAAILQPFLGV